MELKFLEKNCSNLTLFLNLGICYNKGHALEKDLAKAKAWYAKAAKQGQVRAMNNLSIVLLETARALAKVCAPFLKK